MIEGDIRRYGALVFKLIVSLTKYPQIPIGDVEGPVLREDVAARHGAERRRGRAVQVVLPARDVGGSACFRYDGVLKKTTGAKERI